MLDKDIIDNLDTLDARTLYDNIKNKVVDVKDMANLEILDEMQEDEYLGKIRSGDSVARQEFIIKNVALVYSIAIEYMDEDKPLADLIRYGLTGLDTAVDRYDKRVGANFAVHAVWWIRQTIIRKIK